MPLNSSPTISHHSSACAACCSPLPALQLHTVSVSLTLLSADVCRVLSIIATTLHSPFGLTHVTDGVTYSILTPSASLLSLDLQYLNAQHTVKSLEYRSFLVLRIVFMNITPVNSHLARKVSRWMWNAWKDIVGHSVGPHHRSVSRSRWHNSLPLSVFQFISAAQNI